MAKRKKSRKTYSRRRRSMGAIGGQMVMDVAGLTLGAVLGKQVGKFLPSLDSRLTAVGTIVLGAFLPKISSTPLVRGIGNGMIAIGGSQLLGGFVPALGATDDVVLLSGIDQIGEMDTLGADISEINGTDISEINGFDEF
jgi:hypothetical protein